MRPATRVVPWGTPTVRDKKGNNAISHSKIEIPFQNHGLIGTERRVCRSNYSPKDWTWPHL